MFESAREEIRLQTEREFASPKSGDRLGMAFELECFEACFEAPVLDWRPVQVPASWALG